MPLWVYKTVVLCILVPPNSEPLCMVSINKCQTYMLEHSVKIKKWYCTYFSKSFFCKSDQLQWVFVSNSMHFGLFTCIVCLQFLSIPENPTQTLRSVFSHFLVSVFLVLGTFDDQCIFYDKSAFSWGEKGSLWGKNDKFLM